MRATKGKSPWPAGARAALAAHGRSASRFRTDVAAIEPDAPLTSPAVGAGSRVVRFPSHLCDRSGSTEQVTLEGVDAELAECFELQLRLNALSHHVQAKGPSELHNHRNHGGGLGVYRAVSADHRHRCRRGGGHRAGGADHRPDCVDRALDPAVLLLLSALQWLLVASQEESSHVRVCQ